MNTQNDISAGIRTDLFDSIRYKKFQGKNGPAIGIKLGKPLVFKWIFQQAWKSFVENIETVDWHVKQSSKSLFGDAAKWDKLAFGVRQAIGRCLRYFVDHGMLPLRVLNPDATGTKYYGLK